LRPHCAIGGPEVAHLRTGWRSRTVSPAWPPNSSPCRAETEPADPEPAIAGWALAGLVQVDMDARVRHIRAGRRGAQLRDAVAEDVRQAANLLETGLASLSRGTQASGRYGSG
jgi:hypothetical protein